MDANHVANEFLTAAPLLEALPIFLLYTFLFVIGHVLDFFEGKNKPPREGYAYVFSRREDFFTRRMYARIMDCFCRPINSAPGSWMDVMVRRCDPKTGMELSGESVHALNLGSYNYLGFAAYDPHCTPRVLRAMREHGWSACAPRSGGGSTPEHAALEREIAAFVGKPAAVTCGMGFATNSAFIPSIATKGTLIVSDSLNHASIVTGARGSCAKVQVFRHNDPEHLERVLRAAVVNGQPRTHRPWRKIVVIVEGIYSMEGEICRLAEIVDVKKRYKAYLYVDEAHSIGALGATGRGVCEHCGVDPADVDVLMGTFTKSFGSCGGYIAGSEELIEHLRRSSGAELHACAMSAPAIAMVRGALDVITGRDGTTRGVEKIERLRRSADYVRERLLRMGLSVLGSWGSPVIPVMIFHPASMALAARLALERHVALVIVGFPATPLLATRARLCISAAHSDEDIEYALDVLDDVFDVCRAKYHCKAAASILDSRPGAAQAPHVTPAAAYDAMPEPIKGFAAAVAAPAPATPAVRARSRSMRSRTDGSWSSDISIASVADVNSDDAAETPDGLDRLRAQWETAPSLVEA